MKKFFIYVSMLAVTMLSAASCGQFEMPGPELIYSDEIVFASLDPIFEVNNVTKATPVTISDLESNGFLVDCVTGAEGSDTEVWSNVSFTKNGSYWGAGKFWPEDEVSYRFYGVYPDTYTMTPTAGGPTISASNEHDIVCAYAPSPTYKTVTNLSFDHIFAKLGTVSVTAAYPYTISDMSIMITPKVGGTYNIYTGAGQTDGTGWSSVLSGLPVDIGTAPFSESLSVTNVNLYLVPGGYSITFSWTATNGEYVESFSEIFVGADLVGGKVNNITATLGGRGTEVKMLVSMTDMPNRSVALGLVPRDNLPTFGGLWIAPSNCLYEDGKFKIKYSDWNHGDKSIPSGEGAYYFYWDLDPTSSASNASLVESMYNISYKGFNDWRQPTQNEFRRLFTTTTTGTYGRNGSTVNGSANKHYSFVRVTDNTFDGVSNFIGMLIYPDDCTITAAEITSYDTSTLNDNVSSSTIDSCVEQGCAFLPAAGRSDNSVVTGVGSTLQYTVRDGKTSGSGNGRFYAYLNNGSISGISIQTDYILYTYSTFRAVRKPFSQKVIGRFTVDNSGKVVGFSQGNLQCQVTSGPTSSYNYASTYWKFADHQWDYIGNTDSGNSFTIGKYVDLFGWVGGNVSTYGLCSNTSVNTTYYGSYNYLNRDWGANPDLIRNIGFDDDWFTLSNAEMVYLLFSRASGTTVNGTPDARYTLARIRTDISTVFGLILIPDNFNGITPDGVSWGTINSASSSYTTCTAAGWEALESAGCVFLPAAGTRSGTSVGAVGTYGYYWTSYSDSNSTAYKMYFTTSSVYGNSTSERRNGYSVRLVKIL